MPTRSLKCFCQNLPFSSLKIRKESECWCPKNCPMIILEYFRTKSKYRWLNRSWSQCCDHVEEEEEVLEWEAAPPCDTWKDRSYLPGGLWPKIITWNKKKEKKKLEPKAKQALISSRILSLLTSFLLRRLLLRRATPLPPRRASTAATVQHQQGRTQVAVASAFRFCKCILPKFPWVHD